MMRTRGVCLGLAVLLLAGQAGKAQDKDKPKKPPVKETEVKGKPLSHWTKALQGKDLLARVEALNALAQAGPDAKPAVPALLGVFRDADAPYLHPLAAVALARVGPAAVPDLQAALKDKVGLVRGGAALALSLMGPDAKAAVPALTGALKDDKEPFVRQTAASALGQMGVAAKPALPTLRAALKDKDAGVRVEAAAALWKAAKEAKDGADVLAAALKDDNLTVGVRAASVLGEIGPAAKGAAAALKGALKAKDATLRVEAAEALWKVAQDADAVLPVLAAAVKDKDADLRRLGARALGSVGGDKAAALLENLLKGDGDPRVCREAACALAGLAEVPRDRVAVLRRGLADADRGTRWWCAVALLGGDVSLRTMEEDVLNALRSPFAPEAEDDPTAPRAIFEVLASPSARAVPPLSAALKSRSPRSRVEAARALGLFGQDARAAVPALVAALGGDDKQARRAAAAALAQVGPEVIPTLTKALGSTSDGTREGAARALGRLGPAAKSALPALKRLLKDMAQGVRSQAALALWNIEGKHDLAVPVLGQVLKDVDYEDRWEALEAIAQIGAEARPPLRGLSDVFVAALKERDARARTVAVRVMWRRDRQVRAVVPLLRDAVADRDLFVRQTAVEVLGELGADGRAIALLAVALEDKDAGVRVAALEGLVRAGRAGSPPGSDGAPLLAALLKNKAFRVRAGAATALGRVGPPAREALPELVAALDDKDKAVRAAAGTAVNAVAADQPDDLKKLRGLLEEREKADDAGVAKLNKSIAALVKKMQDGPPKKGE